MASNGPLLPRRVGFEFFCSVMCTKQAATLWLESFLDSATAVKKGSRIKALREINVHVVLHGAAELAADCTEERRPELLTPADPNPP